MDEKFKRTGKYLSRFWLNGLVYWLAASGNDDHLAQKNFFDDAPILFVFADSLTTEVLLSLVHKKDFLHSLAQKNFFDDAPILFVFADSLTTEVLLSLVHKKDFLHSLAQKNFF